MAAKRAERVVLQGHSVIVDGVFARESERSKINEIAKRLHIRQVGLFLVADVAIRMRRVGGRTGDASDATPAVAEHQETYDLGTMDWNAVDASGTPEQTLQRCQTNVSVDPEPADEPHPRT
jgi:predicted kinase